jgi:hypothetical protein
MNKFEEEQLITFETAKLLKEKGFTEKTIRYFDTSGDNCSGLIPLNWNMSLENIYSRPTQTYLQKWFREVHNIQVLSLPFAEDSTDENSNTKYHPLVNHKHFYGFIHKEGNEYDSYEKALEVGLIEALNLIKSI